MVIHQTFLLRYRGQERKKNRISHFHHKRDTVIRSLFQSELQLPWYPPMRIRRRRSQEQYPLHMAKPQVTRWGLAHPLFTGRALPTNYRRVNAFLNLLWSATVTFLPPASMMPWAMMAPNFVMESSPFSVISLVSSLRNSPTCHQTKLHLTLLIIFIFNNQSLWY